MVIISYFLEKEHDKLSKIGYNIVTNLFVYFALFLLKLILKYKGGRKMFKRAAIFISIFIIIIAISVSVNSHAGAKANTPSKKPVPLYVLKNYNGKVAVFKYNSNVPQETLSVYTNSLPLFDQKQLTTGVYAYNEQELTSLIEDYDS